MLAENCRILRDNVFEEGLETGIQRVIEKGMENGLWNGIECGPRSSLLFHPVLALYYR